MRGLCAADVGRGLCADRNCRCSDRIADHPVGCRAVMTGGRLSGCRSIGRARCRISKPRRYRSIHGAVCRVHDCAGIMSVDISAAPRPRSGLRLVCPLRSGSGRRRRRAGKAFALGVRHHGHRLDHDTAGPHGGRAGCGTLPCDWRRRYGAEFYSFAWESADLASGRRIRHRPCADRDPSVPSDWHRPR